MQFYVKVAPLRVIPDVLTIQRGRRPAFATRPALLSNNLSVDLDRVMGVDNSIVAKWSRTPGFTSEANGRAHARKRVRFWVVRHDADFEGKR